MRSSFSTTAITAALLISRTPAQADSSLKRGITYIDGGAEAIDYGILLSSKSPLSWYYNWLPTVPPSDMFQGNQSGSIEFVPTIHNLDHIDNNISAIGDLSKTVRHLFTFNEPDEKRENGGSDLDPQEAAQVYIDKIVPLRERFSISHPVVTGSPRGLQWLTDFNAACWTIDSKDGCPADFAVAHWYGDFAGMSSWIGQLEAWYTKGDVGLQGDFKLWVTELGLAGADNASNYAVMDQTLPYLDQLSYVEKYAWFGVFRPATANKWTGSGLSLFQSDGGLTELGALYLGGEGNGFSVGDKGQISEGGGSGDGNGDNQSSALRTGTSILWICAIVLSMNRIL
ncbi:glycosyl hydrolase catalytic core-domain-containing protein [Xylariales sp. AK1849]|nr:glycosyl hydrolase catalytic core-domain-containing protein [Xylariales sp. AK1849]